MNNNSFFTIIFNLEIKYFYHLYHIYYVTTQKQRDPLHMKTLSLILETIENQGSSIENQESRSLKNDLILARKTIAKDKALNNAACN